MARIPMTSGFTLIPEGEYVFRIYDVQYDEEFGKLMEKRTGLESEKLNKIIGSEYKPGNKIKYYFQLFSLQTIL